MTKKEKKDFLQGDIIDRMIRIERRVSASTGKKLPIRSTTFYQNLTEEERKLYNKHKNTKQGKHVGKLALLLSPL